MEKSKNQKGFPRNCKADILYGPSFDFSDLVSRLKKLKAVEVSKNTMFFKESQNCLPLYRPFSTFNSPKKLNQTHKFPTTDLISAIDYDEFTVKHRRQASEKIEKFELRPIKVSVNDAIKKKSLTKTSRFERLNKIKFIN